MITLVIILALVAICVLLAYLLGFRVGGASVQSETHRIRDEAHEAQRRLNELTRHAFVAMTEHVQAQRKPPAG